MSLTEQFLEVAEEGNLNTVRELIESKKVDVNSKDEVGWTALHIAAENGHLDTVKYLIENTNIDFNSKAKGGYTALHYAAQYGHLDIVNYLIAYTNFANRFLIEKIIGHKMENGKLKLKVKWVGWPLSRASYEDAKTLYEDVPALVTEYIESI